MKIKGIEVTDSQAAIYGVLRQFPDGLADHALVPLAQHQLGIHQSSSGIRTRRAELTAKGLTVWRGVTKTASGRSARIFGAK